MKIAKESFDESSLPDEYGRYLYRHTGFIFTFSEDSLTMVFRVSDDEPSIARLMQPDNWYADLFESNLFRQATDHLNKNEGISTIAAYGRMNGATTLIQLPYDKHKI
jgi:hypothetical protein